MKEYSINHPVFPQIPPIPDNEYRPLWSVVIPCWKNLEYLETTLQSVLNHHCKPTEMQIVICHDPHDNIRLNDFIPNIPQDRIEIFEHNNHVGHTRNFNTCIRLAKGHLVHILHADDQVRPGFYNKLTQTFKDNPDIDAAFTRFIYIDPDEHWRALAGIEISKPGIFAKFMDQIAVRNFLISSAFVVKRQVYEKVGGFCEQIQSYEDWEMWKRIGMVSTVWYEPEPLTLYRIHSHSLGNYNRNQLYILEGIEKGIKMSQLYFPEQYSKQWTSEAKRNASHLAIKLGRHYLKNKKFLLSTKYILKALKLNKRLEMIVYLYRYLKDIIRYVPFYAFRQTEEELKW